ncbi:tetratricopeptide repeat protein [bacterium]|nr:tetratricopeptide repeat protein [bacterium]
MAQDLERQGNYRSALRIYRSLFEQVPNNQLYYEGVKRNMLRLKNYDELIAIIHSQSSRSRDVKYPADLGNVYYRKGDQDRAFAIWTSLLNEHPQNKAVYPYVASAMLSNRLYDEAIEVYRTARQQLSDPLLFVYELANIYVIRLNYKEATLEYLRYLELNPQQFGYIEGRIASYTKEPEQAELVAQLLRENLTSHKQKYLIRRLLADLYLRVEEYAQSLQEFRILESEDNPLEARRKQSGKEIYFFAEKALKAGEYQFAREAFDLILSKHPNSPYRIRAIYGAARAKHRQGLFEEAIQNYHELVSSASQSPWAQEALFQIGEIYFQEFFQVDKALATYGQILTTWPNGKKTIDAYFRKGDCHVALGELETAQSWYEKPLKLNTSNASVRGRALYMAAYVDFLRGDFDPTLEKLNKITESMGQKKVDQSYVNDALELIILIEENRDSSAEALELYVAAQRWRLQRNHAEAIKTLQTILADYPAVAIVDESFLDLGELENQRQNYSAAIDYFESLVQEQSESVYAALAQKRIGEVYEMGLGDYQMAYEAYEQVLVNHPQSLYVEEVRQKLRSLQARQLSN